MKRIITAVAALTVLLALLLALPALAADKGYINKKSVDVYDTPGEDGNVVGSLKGGTEVEAGSLSGDWVNVTAGSVSGWVPLSCVQQRMPMDFCNHDWSPWTTDRESTCSKAGLQTRQCSICFKGEEKEIKKLDHTYGDWKVVTEATCTKEGKKTRTCKVCKYEQTKAIKKIPHDYGAWTIIKVATCTEKGERTRTCKNCDHTEKETFLEPHTYGEWEVSVEPTCTEKGEQKRVCAICGREEKKSLNKLPHEYEETILVEATDHSAGIRAKICKNCGHDGGQESFDPEGTLRRRDKGEEVARMQQLLVDQGYLKAGGADGSFGSGTEKALKQFQADQGLVSDGIAWPQTLQRLDHEFGPWEIVRRMTRTEPGDRVRVCSECGWEQHESIEAGKTILRGDKGGEVRGAQRMLGQLGYNVGKIDGAYGKKLDAAMAAFAADRGLTIPEGGIRPCDQDALVSAWTASVPDDRWAGNAPGLQLTVSHAGEPDEDGVMTCHWALANESGDEVTFNALVLSFGRLSDFRSDVIALSVDDIALEPNGQGTASGSFVVDPAWGQGDLHLAALCTEQDRGEIRSSNTVVIANTFSPAAMTVVPQSEPLDVNALPDGDYPVAFDPAGVKTGASGMHMDAVHIYTTDVYDSADIRTLRPGDSIIVEGAIVAVETVEEADGSVHVNGGMASANGYTFSPVSGEGSGYCVWIDDGLATCTERGMTSLVLDPAAVYTLTTGEGATTHVGEDIIAAMQTADKNFTRSNTSIRVEAGRVVGIVHAAR